MAHSFTKVEFQHFKAFRRFKIDLRHFNILVGPNNAGKSTIIAAFRILSSALRRANSKRAKVVRGPNGPVSAFDVDLSTISVAEENIFYNYDDDEIAFITFTLSNSNLLTLYFPEQGVCYLIPDAQGKNYSNPAAFREQFDCSIGFVPILGPVEHHEPLYGKDAARLALFSYRAARNFRNIWYHYPEHFDEFRSLLQQTWPGMDIGRPEIDRTHEKPRLHMFCPEKRIPRELFWSGFGFQVWCQMLTHVIQSKRASIFLIDEPDIYLHSDLQRQLLGILRDLGPDILIATHSTEMITEAETDNIVLVNKEKSSARRIRDPSQLADVFHALGSNLNPILTQLAKTRRVVFVEGTDFQIIGKFARKCGMVGVGNRRDFAVVSIEGFNPDRVRNLKAGMEATLGGKIRAAVILDRDYRSEEECSYISKKCEEFSDRTIILKRKEIENYLLVTAAVNRAISQRITEREKRESVSNTYHVDISSVIEEFCSIKKAYVSAHTLDERRRFERIEPSGSHSTRVTEIMLGQFEDNWKTLEHRLNIIPGKELLSHINKYLQEQFSVSVTSTSIIDSMRADEIPREILDIIRYLKDFSELHPPS